MKHLIHAEEAPLVGIQSITVGLFRSERHSVSSHANKQWKQRTITVTFTIVVLLWCLMWLIESRFFSSDTGKHVMSFWLSYRDDLHSWVWGNREVAFDFSTRKEALEHIRRFPVAVDEAHFVVRR